MWKDHDKICWMKSKNLQLLNRLRVANISKQLAQKSDRHKKLEFENYKNCLEATKFENKISHLEKNKTDIDRNKENHKEFIKSNKSILKTK